MNDVMKIANLCYLEPVLCINLNYESKKYDDSKKHPNSKKRFNQYDDNDLEEMKINDIKTYKRIMKNRRTANNSRLNRINIINNLKTENEHIKSKNKYFKNENERIKNENNDLKIENERYKNITFIVNFENKHIKKENNDLKTENKRYKKIINKYKRYKEPIE
jgi:hypothetical protein